MSEAKGFCYSRRKRNSGNSSQSTGSSSVSVITSKQPPSGKRALLCCISYKKQKCELKGTIHDMKNMKDLLVHQFHFPIDSILILAGTAHLISSAMAKPNNIIFLFCYKSKIQIQNYIDVLLKKVLRDKDYFSGPIHHITASCCSMSFDSVRVRHDSAPIQSGCRNRAYCFEIADRIVLSYV